MLLEYDKGEGLWAMGTGTRDPVALGNAEIGRLARTRETAWCDSYEGRLVRLTWRLGKDRKYIPPPWASMSLHKKTKGYVSFLPDSGKRCPVSLAAYSSPALCSIF